MHVTMKPTAWRSDSISTRLIRELRRIVGYLLNGHICFQCCIFAIQCMTIWWSLIAVVLLFGLMFAGLASSSWSVGLISDMRVIWHLVAIWLLRVIPLNHACLYELRCMIFIFLFLCLSCSFPSSKACFLKRIFDTSFAFDGRLSCKLILSACIFFRHQRKVWCSSAARLLWVILLDHACLRKFLRLSFLFFCVLCVSVSCLQSRAASRHRYVKNKLNCLYSGLLASKIESRTWLETRTWLVLYKRGPG